MDEIIKADLYRCIPGRYSVKLLIQGFRSQGFRYMFFKRKLDKQRKGSIKWLIIKTILRHYTYKYGFQIGGNIGKGLYISHFGTIITSVEASVGDNCNIAPGVIIGVTRRGAKKGAPIIGNEVWIGAGSVIVGKISIGNNVLIAPGAYVNFDVPDNSIVLGNPGQITPNLEATKDYINNKYKPARLFHDQ